ncbi:EF-P lysine aminoacylase GenX [Pseudomaricurvus alkylphenolicus]|uniref:EF-P lysine aminoacylase EpmA n=1 Tax=Pseudomaricurvus alkylphenolicus TaxID=1306991 RepID=UPI00141FC764|nr:EF-P lysine aminoacylase GenX [Pseudomaricurvus alkylphenolicus]
MMTTPDWQPSADMPLLRARAQLYAQLRTFFAERRVLEVEVPLLARAAATDPHIDSISASVCGELLYLQSSPEFFLKRLLAAGSGDIYSLGKAFRNGEAGRRHNPEFTMLEWYRLGWDDQQLMDEVEALIVRFCAPSGISRCSYRDLFERHLGIDPHKADAEQLSMLARQHIDADWQDNDRDVWLDLLMTHVIEPAMGEGLVFVYDFPETQAALARVQPDEQGQSVAKRFEAYVRGVELANGYFELTDAEEQASRFCRDIEQRKRLGLPLYRSDEKLVQALNSGLPDCAGVALGVDRLLMLSSDCDDIRRSLAFAFERI